MQINFKLNERKIIWLHEKIRLEEMPEAILFLAFEFPYKIFVIVLLDIVDLIQDYHA